MELINQIINDDCFNVMPNIPDESIDCIISDMPYNLTACSFDKQIIDLDKLWIEYKRITKPNAAIVLFGSQPFTSKLVMSNPKMFKYELIWDKVSTTSGVMAKKQPMKKHENILIFYNKQPTYNPQMTIGTQWKRGGQNRNTPKIYGDEVKSIGKPKNDNSEMKYPKSIITISNANRNNRLHPTQKSLELIEYLVKTYTQENEIVLDTFAGSSTLAIACLNLNRKYICIEKDTNYYEISLDRINKHENK